MKEYEQSFLFDIDNLNKFFDKTGLKKHNELIINDYYLDKNTRLRETVKGSDFEYKFCTKFGDKSNGVRDEFEDNVTSDILIKYAKEHSKLRISKKRSEIKGFPKTFKVTVDIVESPIYIGCIEVESNDFVSDIISKQLFGTQLKNCPLSAFDYYKRRIGFCGAPSSGKSTTAQYISYNINTKLQGNSFHVTEYATTFLQKYNRLPSVQDQLFIWYGQKERENAASRKHDITISDCPTFLAYIYTQIINKQFTDKEVFYFSKLYKRVLEDIQNYTDLVFMNLINYKENNVRYQNKDQALNIENKIKNFLDDHSIKYISTDYNQKDSLINKLFYLNEIG